MVEQPKFYYKVVPLELEKIAGGKGFHMRKARYYVSDTMKGVNHGKSICRPYQKGFEDN